MAFQRFTESGKGLKPIVSIRPNGTIGVNEAALKKFQLQDSQFVALYYDPEIQKIAFGRVEKSEAGAQRLNRAIKGASISAKRFLDYYDLHVSEVSHFNCHYDTESGLIVIDDKIEKKQKQIQSDDSFNNVAIRF